MRISILGCGWLGLPLAEYLRDQGFTVKGSTTTPEKLELLKGKNIDPYLIELNPELQESNGDFWDSEALLLNIPPGRRRKNVELFHQKQIGSVIEKLSISPVSFVIFVSSTSVYPQKEGILSEEDVEAGKAARASGNALLKAENMLLSQPAFDTTVIRFGGLYGYDRHPVHYLSGRKDLERGNAPVNLIHRDDCIAIIFRILTESRTNEIYNAVSDGHPPRKMYYPAVAKSLGLAQPTFKNDPGADYKVVSNRKLKHHLNYTFKYPNPMDF